MRRGGGACSTVACRTKFRETRQALPLDGQLPCQDVTTREGRYLKCAVVRGWLIFCQGEGTQRIRQDKERIRLVYFRHNKWYTTACSSLVLFIVQNVLATICRGYSSRRETAGRGQSAVCGGTAVTDTPRKEGDSFSFWAILQVVCGPRATAKSKEIKRLLWR